MSAASAAVVFSAKPGWSWLKLTMQFDGLETYVEIESEYTYNTQAMIDYFQPLG